jgi:hypothetical protein
MLSRCMMARMASSTGRKDVATSQCTAYCAMTMVIQAKMP